jgi:hypothetical protein
MPKKGGAWGSKIAHTADDDDGEDKNGFVNREACGVYVPIAKFRIFVYCE